MYIPDNNDTYTAHEREADRIIRRNERIFADEEGIDCELPWVEVPDDYGTHKELYFEEENE